MQIQPNLPMNNQPLSESLNASSNPINIESLCLSNGIEIEIAPLVELAQDAGKKIMEIYQGDFSVEYKSDASPLTQADQASNDIICSRLTSLYPELKIISEESKEIPFHERSSEEHVWLVDPLDGTKEFVKKTGEFTVNIGLCENGSPILGIVNVPAQNLTYFAAANRGAFKLDHKTGSLTPLHVSTFSKDDPHLRLVVSVSHPSKETDAFVSHFEDPQLVCAGSSLKLLMVAEGTADIYPRLAPTMEWDTAAAHAILLEAGGSCVQSKTDQDVIYNKENLLNPYFVCYGNVTDGHE